jgi:hypothetical protein
MSWGGKPAPKKKDVMEQVAKEKAKELQGWMESLKWNEDREHPLGVVQIGKDEFPGTRGINGSERQYFDPRYNVWSVKFLCSFWGRNAWSSDTGKGGCPFEVTDPTYGKLIVFCHIDIATPRDNFLRHGKVCGPHIVIEYFKKYGEDRVLRLDDNCIELTPDHVYKLALHQHGCWKAGTEPGASWPPFLVEMLREACTAGIRATEKRKAKSTTSIDDEDIPLFDFDSELN